VTPDTTTNIAMSPAVERRSPNRRSVAVDFFRGLGLLMVYVDHVFPNVWHSFTLQGIGLSDFAEIFVFLSGYVNAAIYGRVLDSGPFRVAFPELFRKTTSRMFKLYAAHLATLAACFALLALFATSGVFVDQRVTNLFLQDPVKYALRALLLLYAPFAHSVLPLYIVFVPFIPLIVTGLRRFPGVLLFISAIIWFLARKPEFTPPQQLTGEAWVFNPFAWQFMLVAGCALRIYQKSPFVLRLLRRPFPLLAAIAVVVVCALKLLALFNPAFLPIHHFSRLAAILQENYGKSVLISYRIAYFFCLLLLAVVFLKKHHHWLSGRWAVGVIRCGRHSLTVFCASVVLATFASLLLAATHGGIWTQLAATLGGVAILLGLARFKEVGASTRRSTGLLPVSSKTYMPAD
jgi:hypothetical protein